MKEAGPLPTLTVNLPALPSHKIKDFNWILVLVNQSKSPFNDDLTKKVKLEVVGFSGQFNSRTFLDWLTLLEDYFTWYHIENPQHVTFVKMKLKGPAIIWWKNIDDHNKDMGRPPITQWEVMKERLEDKYLPTDYLDSFQRKLINLQ